MCTRESLRIYHFPFRGNQIKNFSKAGEEIEMAGEEVSSDLEKALINPSSKKRPAKCGGKSQFQFFENKEAECTLFEKKNKSE